MAVTLRSRKEIELMRRAGAVVASVLSKLQEVAEPGVTTAQLDRVALEMVAEAGAEALFKGVRSPQARQPFPGAICASVNDEVVHGIPSETTVLRAGDLLSVDFGVRLGGYCGDSATTVAIGEISSDKRRLMDATKGMLDVAIAEARPGVRWSQVARKMQQYVEDGGFSVVRDFVGHGIGTKMHEDPKVPNFVSRELLADDIFLTEGMVLAVEPMVNAGSYHVRTLANGWTVVTKDGKCSAHFEHTLAIVKGGCDVLTARV
ncbi:MAG: type I methionyl aminopeptidase [Sedimentisphaerales bacterium]|jgi:methionyl aminopeptidase|nr:type I methionyl aminopeptidase [Planctomycetota bacterium]MDY0357436.1 type I methionyl aminopeptidase [Sedimentisphaerales bacterium]NLT76032.1 type I methionyl aminopeptidase [Planctomycetota bacterium]